MKILKRVLLTNWYFIDCEVLDFEFINFITGKTGAGKSTIIDALQILFLGDTSGRFFNKAANDKSARTLKGYLYGEISDNGEADYEYKRANCNFASYIASEFYDDIKNKYFTLGVHFDCFADGDFDSRFFILDSRLPDNLFIQNDKAMDYKELKEFYKYEANEKIQFYNVVAYQEAMRGKLGALGKKFFSIFKKAVPFTPIDKIEKFISEFICDVKNNIEIQSMQSNIIHYKQLEGEAENIKERINLLKEIDKKFKDYQIEDNRFKEQSYLMDRSYLEKFINNIEKLKLEAEEKENEIAVLGQRRLKLKTEYEEVQRERDRLVEEKATSDINKEAEKLKEEKAKYEREIDLIEELKVKTLKRHRNSLIRWKESLNAALERIPNYKRYYYEKTCKALEVINALLKLEDDKFIKIIGDQLEAIRGCINEFISDISNIYHENEAKLKDITEKIESLKLQIKNLEQGIKPYDNKLIELKDEIEKTLCSKFNRSINLYILSEVLDIKDKRWQNAIEAYLHNQKFYLLVDPVYFVEALKRYDELKFERGIFDKGIIDIEKLMTEKIESMEGSLAEEIITENAYARLYTDYILGRVVKCEKVEVLRNYKIAITPTCMLYQGYVARQLNEERWRFPFIGKHSIEEQIKLKKVELKILIADQGSRKRQSEILDNLKAIETVSENEIEDTKSNCSVIMTLKEIKEKHNYVVRALGKLNWAYLLDYDAKIAKAEEARGKILEEDRLISESITKLQGRIEFIASTEIKANEQGKTEKEEKVRLEYEREWVESIGEARFERELRERNKPENIINAFYTQLPRTESQRDAKWVNLINIRSEYNSRYMASFNTTTKQNDQFEAEENMLKNTLITEYEAKIKDAREKAQVQFREDFISKLKENIDTIKAQIDDMNKALKTTSFGKDSYHFEVKPNQTYRKYYEMIMDKMLLDGFNLFSAEFQLKHRDTIEELFNNIAGTASSNLYVEERKLLEENIMKYTDFRTYLTFDLIVKDELSKESRLSRMLLKKSGGETQTPFYIAVLASFVQMYRINMSGESSNTLRLIIFDEAFSKMDDERIQESIKLLRGLGFQAIIAAPTEKVGNIAPIVDRTLLVTKIKGSTVVRGFDPKKLSQVQAV
jgi:uncharacterized protein YPO0396